MEQVLYSHPPLVIQNGLAAELRLPKFTSIDGYGRTSWSRANNAQSAAASYFQLFPADVLRVRELFKLPRAWTRWTIWSPETATRTVWAQQKPSGRRPWRWASPGAAGPHSIERNDPVFCLI